MKCYYDYIDRDEPKDGNFPTRLIWKESTSKNCFLCVRGDSGVHSDIRRSY